jgi:hypothetical protein
LSSFSFQKIINQQNINKNSEIQLIIAKMKGLVLLKKLMDYLHINTKIMRNKFSLILIKIIIALLELLFELLIFLFFYFFFLENIKFIYFYSYFICLIFIL